MLRIASLTLALLLSGCGYKTWSNPPFTAGYNPNIPVNDAENMRRVQGHEPSVATLTTEPGDIWPGPLAPPPTLRDLESTGGLTSQPEAPVPGSPLSRGLGAPYPSPNPSSGSSTPPGNAQPGMANPQSAPPLSSYASPPAAPPSRGQAGQVLQTPGGPAVTTGGGPGYQTTINPGGGQSIVVPNGNGTSTVIRSDGRIETIPTPKWQLDVSWASRWTIVYFAWLRERTGATQEKLALPDDVETIADLVNYLSHLAAR